MREHSTFEDRFTKGYKDFKELEHLKMEPIWEARKMIAKQHRRFRIFFMFIAWFRRTFIPRNYNYNSAFLRYLAGEPVDVHLLNKTIVLIEPSMFRRDETYIEGPFELAYEAILAAEDAVARHPFGEAIILRASEQVLMGEKIIWPGYSPKEFTGGYRDSAIG